ncbi:nuclear transport factor 2 family protein [soil metagenome]
MSGIPAQQDVASILAIHMLKARYFRYVDGQDWEALADLFTPDATLHFVNSQDAPLPLKESIAFIASAVQGATTIHHGHMPEIELSSPTTAHGIWAMEDRLYWAPGSASRLGLAQLHGLGYYHEEYAQIAGHWLIRRLKVTRTWQHAIPD